MTAPVLDVVIPVHNEQHTVAASVRRLHAHLVETFPYPFRITVADNASTDGTLRVAERVARELREVTVVRLPDTGRGNALRTVWLASPSPVLAYMDVNLSTDLAALAPLIAPLISGHSDLAIGTRLSRSSLRVHEVPVDWVNDADAGVDLVRTALADLRGMGRLGRDLATGRIPVPELRSALDSNSAAAAPAERPSITAATRL